MDLASIGLLVLRVGAGLTLALKHGWGKVSGFAELVDKFPDPLGVGRTWSLGLAGFAEFACALFLVVGFATRLAAIPIIVTMLVAFFIIHGADPFSKKELALMYLLAAGTLLFTGAGSLSIDRLIRRKRRWPF